MINTREKTEGLQEMGRGWGIFYKVARKDFTDMVIFEQGPERSEEASPADVCWKGTLAEGTPGQRLQAGEFPGGAVVRTQHFLCGGPGFKPCLGN